MADSSDELEIEDFRPLRELRASLHNLYNYDIFAGLPFRAQKRIVRLLPRYDMENARLVCRTWNSIVVKHMKFWVELSDLSRYLFMKLPSLENLIVTRIVTRNLTKLINPLNPSDTLHNFRMRSSNDVRKLVLREETSLEVVQKMLRAYHDNVEELFFCLRTFPIFPAKTSFDKVTRLEITTIKYDEDQLAIKKLFEVIFPLLETLKLDFYVRNDIYLYLGAHYFAATHNTTLKNLIFNFGYYLSDIDKYSKAQVFKSKEVQRKNTVLKLKIEKEKQYKFLDVLLATMKLTSLHLNLSLHEGTPPWNISLKLIDVQRCLQQLDVQYPLILANYSFSEIVLRNAKHLIKVSIPCVENFDCAVLAKCTKLESFSVGKEFSFNYLFFGTGGSLANFPKFPRLAGLKSVSICVPLTKAEIIWLSSSTPTHSLLVYGVENEFFSFPEVKNIILERNPLEKVMMRIYMNGKASKVLEEYFKNNQKLLSVAEYFRADDCGFTTFVVKKPLEVEENVIVEDLEDDMPDNDQFDDIRDYEPLVDNEQD
ncbi:unnamed protein product [Allacma fusca]|uniref:F-box domain-containing protein n=2 Tax=Allacma fusca TaxID=39272 RepID=A0A8J2PUG0_9HEXA|nr:unnamed protein product [Allacma fusca]